ncbi:MAG: hypothetical protein RR900_01445, partial [Ruthenibacterium sp.]
MQQKDREILRALADEQMTLANSPANKACIKAWYQHNACAGERPMVHLEMDTFEQEVIPPLLRCEDEKARTLETMLYRNFLNCKLFKDDTPVPNYFPVPLLGEFIPFGLEIAEHHAHAGDVGYAFESPIQDLENDYAKLGAHVYRSHKAEAQAMQALAEDTFGDILPTRLESGCVRAVPTQLVVKLMGMETMFFSMMDYPDLFKEMMQRIAQGYLGYYDFLAKEKLLTATVANEIVGQGTFAYNAVLPSGAITNTRQMWGFMDSQESVGISAEMYHEFVFPCYYTLAQQYGMLSYGCCEPVNSIWEQSVSQYPNLKKVSISPWCDEEFMGEKLRGTDIIYHRKPNANLLGVGAVLDEDAVKAHILKTLHAILQLVEDIIQCYKKRPQIKAKATNGCHPKQIVEID